MPKNTYLIELRVDQQWLEAIDKLTGEIYDGEVCDWIRIQPDTEPDDQDCENCEENPKEHPEGKWCTSCRDDFKESDEDDEQCGNN